MQLLGIYLIRGTDRARIQRGKRCIAAQRRASHWHALLNPLQFDGREKKRFQSLFAQWSLFRIARATLYIESRWKRTKKCTVHRRKARSFTNYIWYSVKWRVQILKKKKKAKSLIKNFAIKIFNFAAKNPFFYWSTLVNARIISPVLFLKITAIKSFTINY